MYYVGKVKVCSDRAVETERASSFPRKVRQRLATVLGDWWRVHISDFFWASVPFAKGLWEAQSGQDGGKVFTLYRVRVSQAINVL